MSISEIISISIYPLLALGAALGVALALGISMHGEILWTTKFVPSIAPLIVLGIAVSSLLSGRELVFAEKHIDQLSTQVGGGQSVLQLLTLAILSIAVAKIIGTYIRRKTLPKLPSSHLFIALMTYIVASNFLPSIFGTSPVFVHSMFYPVLIFSAAWVARREPLKPTVNAAKAALFALMFGSLIAALVVPSIAVQPDYEGLIPALKIRLWGLGSNPNSIGPLALLTLLLEYLYPTRNVGRRTVFLIATFLVFVLAQSKTVWLALIIILTVLGWYRLSADNPRKASLIVALAFLIVGIAFFSTLLIADIGGIWDRFADSKVGASLTTVSGRTSIWEVAVKEWLRNPLFGYGPEIWGLKFRIEIGMPFAFSAHNQFMQTLSAAGALGFVSLLVYIGYLTNAAVRTARLTKGVSVALLSMILFRCLSETPLTMTGLIDGDAVTHFLLFTIILRAPTSSQIAGCAKPSLVCQWS